MEADAKAVALWEQAQRYVVEKQFAKANQSLVELIKANPWSIPARLLLATVLLAEGSLRAATEQLKYAAFSLPDDPGIIHRIAQALLKTGESSAALACMRHPAIARCQSGPALAALGHIWQGLGLHASALELMNRARDLGMNSPDFRYFRAIQLQFNGKIEEARAELESCLQAGPTFGRASLMLARSAKANSDTHHLDFIAARLEQVEQGSEDHASFEFARYKELEDLGRDDEAWEALERANQIMHQRLQHDVAEERETFDRLIELCDSSFVHPHRKRFEGPVPIFILGMPRSGTTLLERILGNHSAIQSAGELADFPRQLRWVADLHGHRLLDPALIKRASELDFSELGQRYLQQTQWRAIGHSHYIDKLPPNYLLAGFIRRALPQAKILHMVRDPMDVCFSNYRAMFGDSFAYSYQFETLAAHYTGYRRVMHHWRKVMPGAIHDVAYDRMVDDTEACVRELLAYCELEFEPGCLDTSRENAPVATLSSAQVREPIHRRGLQEWRRYETKLAPLAKLIDSRT